MKFFSRTLALSAGLFLLSCTAAAAVPTPYPDIETYRFNFEAVTQMKIQGVFAGYPDGSFRGDQAINRAELAKVLVESFGFTDESLASCVADESGLTFSDVPEGQWYTDYVLCARNLGWVSGDDDLNDDLVTTYRPSDGVNVAEATKMLTLSQLGDPVGVASGDQWYDIYYNWLEDLGISKYSSGSDTLSFTYTGAFVGTPGADASRASVAEFLYRLGYSSFNPREAFSSLDEFDQVEFDVTAGNLIVQNNKYGFRINSFDLDGWDLNDLRVYVEDPSGAKNGFMSSWSILAPNQTYPWPNDYDTIVNVTVFDADYYDELLADEHPLTWGGVDAEANGLAYQVSCLMEVAGPLENLRAANCSGASLVDVLEFSTVEI